MNIKQKTITFVLILSCAATPLLADASVSVSPSNLLAAISVAFENDLASLSAILSHAIVSPAPGSTTSTTSRAPVATTTTRSATSTVITLQLGNKSVIVAVLQRGLISGGYLKPPATGIFDANTQAAVEAFQKAKNLPVTGYIQMTPSGIASSFAATASAFVPIKAGATGAQANALQSVLIKKGNLKISTTTAYFGTLTQAALKAFQASHNIPQTGIVDQATFAALNGN